MIQKIVVPHVTAFMQSYRSNLDFLWIISRRFNDKRKRSDFIGGVEEASLVRKSVSPEKEEEIKYSLNVKQVRATNDFLY